MASQDLLPNDGRSDVSLENSGKERVTISDVVSPYLEPIYEVFVDDIIKKYDIKLPTSFWFVFSLFIFSIIIIYFKIDYQASVFFFFLALIILLANNKTLIKKSVFVNKNAIIDDYISKINTKNLNDTIKFIKEHPYKLRTENIISIFEGQYRNNPEIYKVILDNQLIHSELLEYIVKNNLSSIMTDDYFCGYIRASLNPISNESIYSLKSQFENNKQIIKTLNVSFPIYLKSHKIFKFAANIRVKIRNSFNYGYAKHFVFIISFILVFSALVQVPLKNFIIQNEGSSLMILSFINYLMAFGVTTIIVMIIITFIISLLMKGYRFVLYYFAPETSDW